MSEVRSLAETLEYTTDLDAVIKAVAREQVIRDGMRQTGESHEIVAEMLDAAICMDHEAVLNLMDGEPTTLKDALARYVLSLESEVYGTHEAHELRTRILGDLNVLIEYSWPMASPPRKELALEVGYPEDDEHLVVTLGGEEVATANHDEHGWSGMESVQRTAEQVYAAMIKRLTR